MCISLVNLLISYNLMLGIETFSMACWHRSVISFGDIVLINSFVSSFVSFVVNVTSYFAYSWHRISCYCLCRTRISAMSFSLVLVIEVLIISA